MDKVNVAHLYIRVLSVVKKNDILNSAYKWIKLENNILSETTQTQKDEYHKWILGWDFT